MVDSDISLFPNSEGAQQIIDLCVSLLVLEAVYAAVVTQDLRATEVGVQSQTLRHVT
jgi:hypothetical protein